MPLENALKLKAGGRKQISEGRSGGNYLSHDDMRIHFGLGETPRVDRVRVRWPNNNTEELAGFEADRYVVIREEGK